ncbi:alpha/beta fold hydrolase [Huintestinicola butyrica]|uniref:alpha/beta hydrolase n=1 Tax=Huintestinicola butyrica TaxID=2981728 RepID=UPI003F7D4D23
MHSLKKILKNALKVVLIIAAIIVLFLAISFVNHKIRSSNEKDLLTPLGELVEVNGHNMSIYVEGDGDKTLVFMSGGGTCSPILDFKSLYSLLSDDYKIVVVEKFGYGFSDILDENRDIDTILSETRMALDKAGIESPYVLCPHSLSGVEALYWAQEYPQEVEAIVGLDMAVPGYYDEMKISIPTVKLGHYGAVLGITRFIPSLAESDAIKFGTLSEKEKEIYRAVFYQKTATVTMINEVKAVKDNANVVKENGIPQVPMLLFISNGSGGTNFTEEMWRSIPKEYISGHDNASYIELDCPHYVHDYEYEEISKEIRNFIK